jgi:hypothetical protein
MKSREAMKLGKVVAIAGLVLSPIGMTAVSLKIPHAVLVLVLILVQNPTTLLGGILLLLAYLYFRIVFAIEFSPEFSRALTL